MLKCDIIEYSFLINILTKGKEYFPNRYKSCPHAHIHIIASYQPIFFFFFSIIFLNIPIKVRSKTGMLSTSPIISTMF